jgi:hypothetical protein
LLYTQGDRRRKLKSAWRKYTKPDLQDFINRLEEECWNPRVLGEDYLASSCTTLFQGDVVAAVPAARQHRREADRYSSYADRNLIRRKVLRRDFSDCLLSVLAASRKG